MPVDVPILQTIKGHLDMIGAELVRVAEWDFIWPADETDFEWDDNILVVFCIAHRDIRYPCGFTYRGTISWTKKNRLKMKTTHEALE